MDQRLLLNAKQMMRTIETRMNELQSDQQFLFEQQQELLCAVRFALSIMRVGRKPISSLILGDGTPPITMIDGWKAFHEPDPATGKSGRDHMLAIIENEVKQAATILAEAERELADEAAGNDSSGADEGPSVDGTIVGAQAIADISRKAIALIKTAS